MTRSGLTRGRMLRAERRAPRRGLVAMLAVALTIGGLVPVVAAAPAAQAEPFDCAAGVVYTLERPSSGTASYVTRVTTASGATQRWPGSLPARVTNGLALSGDGSAAYAIDQGSGSTTSLYTLTSDGTSSTVATNLALSGVASSVLVGGAINPANGYYYFGGYGSESFGGTVRATFELHAYNLVTNTYIGRVGRVVIAESSGSGANGDIAFDGQGNLYLIWSNTNGVTNKLVRVDAGSVPTTAGSSLVPSTLLSSPASSTNKLAYNGMTFDGNGTLFLQNSNSTTTTVAPTDPNSGAPTSPAVTLQNVAAGVDLASCSYPPTIRLLKNVVARFPATDQFALAIYRTDVTDALATATTAGTATGVQPQVAGPAIAIPGRTYRIQESGASGTNLADYLTTYECHWGADALGSFSTGTGVGLVNGVKSVTLPVIPSNRSGQQLSCTFTNSPLAGSVTITKQVQDAFGQNQHPVQGWTVGSATTATTGAVTQTPTATTQVTDASGNAAWALAFAAPTARASVSVSETQQAKYIFVSASCVVTPAAGTPRTVTFNTAGGGAITGVAPADAVACTFVNRVEPTYLTLVKSVTNTSGGTAQPTAWTLSATGPTSISGVTGTAPVTREQVADGGYGLGETGPDGYTLSNLACATSTGAPIAGVSVTNPRVQLAPGSDVTCTFTNTDRPARLTLVKSVQNGTTGGIAVPSNWTLTATPNGIPGQGTVSGVSGSSSVTNRQVFAGSYTLSESGPAGYTPGDWSCPGFSVTGSVVTVPSGGTVTCTITNTAQAPRLTLVKQVSNGTTGGPGVPADWTLTAAGPVTITGKTGDAAVTQAVVQVGRYDLGEASDQEGYDLGELYCVDAAGNRISGVTPGNPEVTLGLADDVTCTFINVANPPLLTLVKVVDDGTTGGTAVPTDWTLTAAGPLTISGESGAPAVTQRVVPVGAYALSEADGPTGYVLADLTCTDEAGNPIAGVSVTSPTVTVALDQRVTCTFTNKPTPPTLTLVKHVDNGDSGGTAGPTDWTLTGAGPVTITGVSGEASVTAAVVRVGTYDLSEAGGPAGYFSGDWVCTGAAVSTASSVTLAVGENATCTITNTAVVPRLTLVKQVNDNQSGGTGTPADWTLTATGPKTITGTSGQPAVTEAPVPVGTYDLTETSDLVGYELGALTCVTDEGVDLGTSPENPTVPIAVGADVTCTFVNDAVSPELTLVKVVDDDTGGTAIPTDWTLTAAGPLTVTGRSGQPDVTDRVVQTGTYDLSETGPGGYALTTLECVDQNNTPIPGVSVDAPAVTIPLGAVVTCTFTNTAIAPRLTLVKVVENGSSGTAQPTDWNLTAAGPATTITGTSGDAAVTDAAVQVGDYDLSEADGPADYDLATLACVNDETGEQLPGTSVADPRVSLDLGDAVTCTFTNVAVRPEWSFFKSANPASGSTVVPGTVITYTVTAVRSSGVPATNVVITDDLSGVLPHATLVDGSITASLGTAALSGTDLVWTIPALSATSTLTYQVTVDADAIGVTIGNVATGTGSAPPGSCPDTEPNCHRTEHFTPAWTIAKSSNPPSGTEVATGSPIAFTLTATNTGPVAVSGAVATDDLSAVLAYSTLTGSLPPGVSVAGTTLTWAVPDIPVDGSVSVTYTVRVDADAAGKTLRNVITATGPVPPADCSAGVIAGRIGNSRVAAATTGAPCATEHTVPPPLPVTGGQIAWGAAAGGGSIALLGALLFLIARRRRAAAGG